MFIGLDLDGTVSRWPVFFREFCHAMRGAGHRIYIVTDRADGMEQETQRQLANYQIEYDKLKITSDKKSYIEAEGIEVLFDDRDQYFADIGPHVAVFKVRDEYNFDFKNGKWLGI